MKIGFGLGRKLAILTVFLAVGVASGGSSYAQEPFYKGKTMRIVVGFAAGGGFDTYARVISRHMGKHIPGHPTIIVENMAGAGSLIAANHVFKVARPDGLTIGHFGGGLFMQQLQGGAGIEFDAQKFEFLGVPVQDTRACALTRASGITSMEQWLAAKTPVKIGATAPGDLVHDAPKILRAALNLPVQIVSGYKGTADIRLAAESGELAGACWGWDSIRATWRKALESGEAIVIVQMVSKPHPDLPKVPLAISYAKTDEARQLIENGITVPAITNRPYVLPPGTPKERVQLLRKAFMDTMKDPEFLADATKSKIDIDPLSGEEVQKIVSGMFKISPSVLARLKEALK
ncbi:MAG TPA: tripartite tricarboxylate transporter substrate-binding protein [Candidatus Acidoferrales bacterium]|nr:tripartite tricarboxylate transporter substrate-binding protein [Candidatus Acidoferrales bacterium]